MKLYIYATEIDKVLVGDFEWSVTASSRGDIPASDWIVIGEVDVDLNINREEMTAQAMQIIDEQEDKIKEELAGKLNLLEMKRSQLLALTHEGNAVTQADIANAKARGE